MDKSSDTETFCVITLHIDSEYWQGVPFISISGKGMDEKKTEFIYNIKSSSYEYAMSIISKTDPQDIELDKIESMMLKCNLYPRNEVFLEINFENEKKEYCIFTKNEVESIMKSKYGHFENHEIIFDSIVNQRSFDCVKYSEAELLWKIFKNVISSEKSLFYYPKGSDIPNEAKELIEEIK